MNIKDADQPAHPRRLISAYVVRLLETIISKLTSKKTSIFLLVSVTEEIGLNLALSDITKTGFLATRPINRAQLRPTRRVSKNNALIAANP